MCISLLVRHTVGLATEERIQIQSWKGANLSYVILQIYKQIINQIINVNSMKYQDDQGGVIYCRGYDWVLLVRRE